MRAGFVAMQPCWCDLFDNSRQKGSGQATFCHFLPARAALLQITNARLRRKSRGTRPLLVLSNPRSREGAPLAWAHIFVDACLKHPH
jgi:hypothetical protein